MAGNSTDPGRSVTSKVTAILMVFADGGVHTLTEIASCANCRRQPRTAWHRNSSPGVYSSEPRIAATASALPLRMIASEYSESEVWTYTLTVMRALPVLDELSRATRQRRATGRASRFRRTDIAAATTGPPNA